MIYHDEDNIYLKLPINYFSVLNRSIIQACCSMKRDNQSPTNSVQAAEFNLLQLANLLSNSEPISKEKGSKMFNFIEDEDPNVD